MDVLLLVVREVHALLAFPLVRAFDPRFRLGLSVDSAFRLLEGLTRLADDMTCRVGGGARLGAGLRPPLKLHVRFSRMQLSRRPDFRSVTQRRNQRNQADQPQLATKTLSRVLLPPRTAP